MCSKVKTNIAHPISSGDGSQNTVLTGELLLKVQLSPFRSYSIVNFFNLLKSEKEVYFRLFSLNISCFLQ